VLLNQLQRSEALEILEADPEWRSHRWKIALRDSQLMATNAEALAHLKQVLESRNSEQNEVYRDIRALEQVLTNHSQDAGCVLVRLFEAVESGEIDADFCGRCWWCRRQKLAPPVSSHYGLGGFWEKPDISFRRGRQRELSIIPDDDHYLRSRELLLQRLARAGVEQFVFPDDFGPCVSATLSGSQAQAGFCLTHSDLLNRGWQLIAAPTAIIFPPDGTPQFAVDRFWNVIRAQRATFSDGLPLTLYVTPRRLILEGRPAVQVLCRGGFCHEHELDDWRTES
jgi:hypothetical protein